MSKEDPTLRELMIRMDNYDDEIRAHRNEFACFIKESRASRRKLTADIVEINLKLAKQSGFFNGIAAMWAMVITAIAAIWKFLMDRGGPN